MKGSPLELDPACLPTPRFSLIRLVTEKVPLFLLSVASSVITLGPRARAVPCIRLSASVWAGRVENAIVSYTRYLARLSFPPHSQPIIRNRRRSTPLAATWSNAIAPGRYRRRTAMGTSDAMAAVGWVWFLGTLVPVIGLVQVGSRQSPIATPICRSSVSSLQCLDRWASLPSVLRG